MTCDKCGMPCQGRKCRDCERMDHQEDYYGTPEDNWNDSVDGDDE